jgi:transcriptional regulator GlxA family with amidase domain
MSIQRTPLHVTLVATPDAQVSPLSGLYETLNAFELLGSFEPNIPARPFDVEIVAPSGDALRGASGLPLGARRTHEDVERTDIAIVPLMLVQGPDWLQGRYPGVVDWLRHQHRHGAMLASTCTGVLLLAETGLLDGRKATLHWAFAPTFRRNYPRVELHTEEVLITTGDRQELVMTGGVMSWHDLALHLIARHVGPTAAQAMARLLMLEWHGSGQAPYVEFTPRLDHGDALVAEMQHWLNGHYMMPNPVDELVSRFGVSRRNLERRLRRATSHSPLSYVQHLRVAEAKRYLERTDLPIEKIAFEIGYENTAFFRRVFKRITRLGPWEYRRKFQLGELLGHDRSS